MTKNIQSYKEAAEKLIHYMGIEYIETTELNQMKHHIAESYSSWIQLSDNHNRFLNWGLKDTALCNEYMALDFNFSEIYHAEDIYSQTLLYYLIKPLITNQFFNKRLVDIGCGNGVGTKLSAKLLNTQYALGIDLMALSIRNATQYFHQTNQINYIQADSEHLPLDNESFDIITNLESSHLYPRIEDFFSEVERVLAPNGFFCYADMHFKIKVQDRKLEHFIKTSKNLKIIQKTDITKMIRASLYHRLIVNEKEFYKKANVQFGNNRLNDQLFYFLNARGLWFLPYWKISFQNPILNLVEKYARNHAWSRKKYFYYLIQKIGS